MAKNLLPANGVSIFVCTSLCNIILFFAFYSYVKISGKHEIENAHGKSKSHKHGTPGA